MSSMLSLCNVLLLPDQTKFNYSVVISQNTPQRWFNEKELYCQPVSKDSLGVTQISVCSEKSCINIKVSFFIICIAGDIPAHDQLENILIHTSYVQKLLEISIADRRFQYYKEGIMRKVPDEVSRGSSRPLWLVSGCFNSISPLALQIILGLFPKSSGNYQCH